MANPGFVRGGHWVYPKTRYRTWSEKARFELEVGDREIFDIGKFHRRNLRRMLVANREHTQQVTENYAERAVIVALF